jgi:uncharacterized protein (TIGR02996 family)
MTQHAGFLQDIIEHPEDDAPRLIYADWLEEHGDPDRGEFIRVQCRLARGCPVCDGTGRNVMSPCPCGLLRRRERELLRAPAALGTRLHGWALATNADAWAGEVLGYEHVAVWEHFFRRGFVAEVTLPCAEWLRQGRVLVRAAPLERVSLTDVRPYTSTAFPGESAWFLLPEDGPDMDPPSDLPAPLFHALPGEAVPAGPEGTGPPMKLFTGEALALDGLSLACLKYARNVVPAAH